MLSNTSVAAVEHAQLLFDLSFVVADGRTCAGMGTPRCRLRLGDAERPTAVWWLSCCVVMVPGQYALIRAPHPSWPVTRSLQAMPWHRCLCACLHPTMVWRAGSCVHPCAGCPPPRATPSPGSDNAARSCCWVGCYCWLCWPGLARRCCGGWYPPPRLDSHTCHQVQWGVCFLLWGAPQGFEGGAGHTMVAVGWSCHCHMCCVRVWHVALAMGANERLRRVSHCSGCHHSCMPGRRHHAVAMRCGHGCVSESGGRVWAGCTC